MHHINIFLLGEEILNYMNYDLENVVTPVNIQKLDELLQMTGYDKTKSQFLIEGFTNGFSIGYEGPMNIKRNAPNLRLRVRSEVELWNKMMKEVQLQRFAGPYESPPFEHYIQSPVGLVPQDDGKKTRLIFHLSYPRSGNSVNSMTPFEICKVKYSDFDDTICRCLEEGVAYSVAKSDMSIAFRNLGIKKSHWPLLLMKARSPLDGKWYFFVDKCLPFGSSISCAHFQAFSDAVAYIVSYFTKKETVNYLDDFLFAALLKWLCDQQVEMFLKICADINFPVSQKRHFGLQLIWYFWVCLLIPSNN